MAKKKKKKTSLLSEKDIRKKYKGSGIAADIIIPTDKTIKIPTSSLALNYMMGGGLPYGKVMEIHGTESSGKSLIAIDFAVIAQSLGGMVLWADAEQAFSQEWMERNGLEMDKIELFKTTIVENISDWAADMAIYYRSQLTNNEPILLVVDSLAALDTEDNINSEQTDAKAEMGNRAKAIYKMLRIRNELLSELGVTSIWINQLRAKVGAGMFEDPDTTPGGNAMKFYASIRLAVYGGKQIKGKVNGYEDRVGRETSIRVKKNKVAPPRPSQKLDIYFHAEYEEIGLSRYQGFPEILERLGIIKHAKGSRKYYFEDEQITKAGEKGLIKKIAKDDDLRSELIEASDINTTSKTRKLIESMGENLYPVKTTKAERHKAIDDDEEEDD